MPLDDPSHVAQSKWARSITICLAFLAYKTPPVWRTLLDSCLRDFLAVLAAVVWSSRASINSAFRAPATAPFASLLNGWIKSLGQAVDVITSANVSAISRTVRGVVGNGTNDAGPGRGVAGRGIVSRTLFKTMDGMYGISPVFLHADRMVVSLKA